MIYYKHIEKGTLYAVKTPLNNESLVTITETEYKESKRVIALQGYDETATAIIWGNAKRKWYVRLKNALAQKGIHAVCVDTTAFLTADLSNLKLAIGVPIEVKQKLDEKVPNIRYINAPEKTLLINDKWYTYLKCIECGIATPKTQQTADGLQYPFVVKARDGSLGKQVYLVSDVGEQAVAEKLMEKHKLIYQEYISSSYGKDVRVICVGGKAVAWFLRKNESDFRSNIATGGHGENIELSAEWKAFAEKVASDFDLDLCGLDILFGENGEPILCEVNSRPILVGIEGTTGTNVIGIYADFIADVK